MRSRGRNLRAFLRPRVRARRRARYRPARRSDCAARPRHREAMFAGEAPKVLLFRRAAPPVAASRAAPIMVHAEITLVGGLPSPRITQKQRRGKACAATKLLERRSAAAAESAAATAGRPARAAGAAALTILIASRASVCREQARAVLACASCARRIASAFARLFSEGPRTAAASFRGKTSRCIFLSALRLGQRCRGREPASESSFWP